MPFKELKEKVNCGLSSIKIFKNRFIIDKNTDKKENQNFYKECLEQSRHSFVVLESLNLLCFKSFTHMNFKVGIAFFSCILELFMIY